MSAVRARGRLNYLTSPAFTWRTARTLRGRMFARMKVENAASIRGDRLEDAVATGSASTTSQTYLYARV